MKYMSADDRLRVREKMHNKPIAESLYVMVHLSLIGASHG